MRILGIGGGSSEKSIGNLALSAEGVSSKLVDVVEAAMLGARLAILGAALESRALRPLLSSSTSSSSE